MLAEVRLVIHQRTATLVVLRNGEAVDEESWSLERNIGRTEAMELAKAVFDDAYDAMNWLVHGN